MTEKPIWLLNHQSLVQGPFALFRVRVSRSATVAQIRVKSVLSGLADEVEGNIAGKRTREQP